MMKSLTCSFLAGSLTEESSLDEIKANLSNKEAGAHEVLYYKKNKTEIWLEVRLVKVTFNLSLIKNSVLNIYYD